MSRLRLSPWTVASVLLRSLTIQASWNYRTLIGTGFAVTLLPILRAVRTDTESVDEAAARHTRVFNSHPYLAPVAVGAVGKMEAEAADPELVERFKAGVRGSLGTLGDRLMWAGWRPVCLLATLAAVSLGAPAVGALVGFLLVYNAGHLALRVWGLLLGLREGMRVATRLRRSAVGRLQGQLATAGTFLVGLLIPLCATGATLGIEASTAWSLAGMAGAGVGAVAGARARGPVIVALVAAATLSLLAGGLA